MLVLSRERDEAIVINDNVKITVVNVRGNKVSLGIEAPREISVHRLEVYDAIHRNGGVNKFASKVQFKDMQPGQRFTLVGQSNPMMKLDPANEFVQQMDRPWSYAVDLADGKVWFIGMNSECEVF